MTANPRKVKVLHPWGVPQFEFDVCLLGCPLPPERRIRIVYRTRCLWAVPKFLQAQNKPVNMATMPVLQFKGKTAIENYHDTVPRHALDFDAKLSVLSKGEKPSLDGKLLMANWNSAETSLSTDSSNLASHLVGMPRRIGSNAPFKRMTYTEKPICSENWPKLIGAYRADRSDLMERLLRKGFKRLIEVG